MALAAAVDPSSPGLEAAARRLTATRPTAVNLRWAVERVTAAMRPLDPEARFDEAYRLAGEIADEDAAMCSAIGDHGLTILEEIAAGKDGPVNVLTHCNAGWLAAVEWGTATAPMYKAHEAGIPVHVWVDETRPRSQGASLTSWELGERGVPHTLVVDNAGGHLMQHGMVDVCIVGSDRTTAAGDVGNKIGTYLKALAAADNGIPFYAALPSSTIDWSITDGVAEIPIEERAGTEVTHVRGRAPGGEVVEVQISPDGTPAANYGFDVTPARMVTGIITERGVAPASEEGLASLFPDTT
jgi:methylthioribose-1-phosphate isomerase